MPYVMWVIYFTAGSLYLFKPFIISPIPPTSPFSGNPQFVSCIFVPFSVLFAFYVCLFVCFGFHIWMELYSILFPIDLFR